MQGLLGTRQRKLKYKVTSYVKAWVAVEAQLYSNMAQ